MKSLLPVLLLALCSPCWGQTIKLTESAYKAEVGQPVTVRVETDGEIVRWSPVDNGLWMSDPTLQITTKAVQAWAMKPGKYRLWAWTAKDNTPSDKVEAVIVVGTPGPDPGPEPGPNPNPTPPTPDGLAAKVKDWISKVDSPRKSEESKAVAELYLNLASQVAAGGITDEDALADAMTKGHAERLGANARLWFGFIQSFGNAVNAASGIKEKGKVFQSVGDILKAL